MLYRKGTRHENIIHIKQIFNILGFIIENYNDIYDDNLYEVVKEYQRLTELTVDGIIGPITLNQIKKDFSDVIKCYKQGKPFKKYELLKPETVVIIDEPPTYDELVKVFGNPIRDRRSFEYEYIRKCDLSIVHEEFKHVKNFNHRNWFGFRCHKYLIPTFQSVFKEIARNNLNNKIKTFNGCFNVRFQRKSHKWSTHSWGIAIDLNANEACFGCSPNTMPQGIVKVFKKYKFTWGGDWRYPDPMHFQYCK